MGLDRLGAEEQLGRDLAVGPAIDDEACDLELAARQRFDPSSVGVSGSRAAVGTVAQPAELAVCFTAVADTPLRVELCRCALQLCDRAVACTGLDEGAARDDAR